MSISLHLGDYSTITCGELTRPFAELGHLLGDSSLVGVRSDRKALSATGLPRLVQASFNSSSPECFARLHSKLDDRIERLDGLPSKDLFFLTIFYC